jgi:hypothetical protein
MAIGARAPRRSGDTLSPAAHIARRFRGAGTWHGLPAVSLLGPRYSGKTQCLVDVLALLDKRKNDTTSAVPILIDLESLGHGSEGTLSERFVALLGSRRGVSRPGAGRHSDAEGGQITQCLKRIGTMDDRGTVVLVDHLDAVSAGFARTVVRSFRVAFDQRDVFPAYRRVGVVFAGSASLSLLRRSGESAFVTDFLAMPSTSSAIQLAGVRKHWPRPTELSREAAAHAALLSGGERPFVELLRAGLGPDADRPGLDAGELDRLAERVCHELSSDIFRELILALLVDRDLWTLVKEVLRRGDGQVERRDVAGDIDVFSLSGVLVASSQAGALARYAFRNELVRRFVACFHAWRERGHPRAPAPPIPDIAAAFDGLWQDLGSGPRVWQAARALGDLWMLLTGARAAPDDIYLRLTPHEPGAPVYWLSARTMTVVAETDETLRLSPIIENAMLGVKESGNGVPCVASDSMWVAVAVAASDDHANLVFVIAQAARNMQRLREHTLSLWQRVIDTWSKILSMGALAEVARRMLATQQYRGFPGQAADELPPARDPDVASGRARLDPSTLRALSQRLAAAAFALNRQPQELVRTYLDDADLPDGWKREMAGRTFASLDDASRCLIRQLLEKGAVPTAPGHSALAVVLAASADRFGREDRELFALVIRQLRNPRDADLLDSLS